MKRRLVILTEIIAPYRIPVFNALAQHDQIDLHVIFLAETDSSIRQWRIYSHEIRFSYEVLPSWRRRVGKYNILVNQQVVNALLRCCPDVILCGGYNYLASWQALRWARRNHVPFLLWCESTLYDRRNRRSMVESLKNKFFRGCDGFVVPGKSSLEYVSEINSGNMLPSAPVFIAPNAVDNDLFSESARRARSISIRLRGQLGLPERYFVFVGRLVEQKGVFDLLNAYASLSCDLRTQVGLVFVGDGPLRSELESCARCIFPGAVHCPGFIQRDELAAYYGLAECFVFPTHSDPWGLVVNEAMACELPVICTRVAGCAADLVRENGRVIDAQNTLQLAAAMQEISSDPELRLRMSQESGKQIQRYSPQACAQGIAKAAILIAPRKEDSNLSAYAPPQSPKARMNASSRT